MVIKKEGRKKVTIAVLISVISVLIAIISLLFSVYVGLKDVEYKQTIKNIQIGTQEIQKQSLKFEQNYKLIELAEKNLFDNVGNCEKVNKYEMDQNLDLLSGARNSLIDRDYDSISGYLKLVNLEKICYITTNKDKNYIEISVLSIIWIVLTLTLIKISFVRIKEKER